MAYDPILESLGEDPDPETETETIDVTEAAEEEIEKIAASIPASEGIGYTAPNADDEPIQEVAITAEEIHKVAKEDLDFLAAMIMPTIFEFPFPPVFQSVWQWLVGYASEQRTFPQLALGLPRGFGKTTLLKIFIVYCILFTDKKFILIIAATASLAENILSDVIDMLNEPNIKRVFGDWSLGVEKDTQSLKKFGFRGRNIIMAAIGAEGSLRGLNLKNERPDIMVFEDIQTRECADSEVQSNSLETWMVGTAMKAKSPKGCMFLFIGNMYPTPHSILRKLKTNPKWTKFIAGGILEDGSSLWEELQPISQLVSEFENDLSMGHPEIFYAEVLNDENAAANNLIDVSSLPPPPMQEGDIPAGNFIIIDPSNDKANSDAVSIGYFEVHNASPVFMEVLEGRLSPGDTVREAIRMGLEKNCRLIVVESNAYQYSLLYWFDFVCAQLGIQGFQFVDMYSGKASKNARILSMFRSLKAGEIYLTPEVRPATVPQILGFNPLRRDNTDGILDLLTYAPRVVAEYGELMLSLSIVETQEFDAMEVIEYNTPF